MNIYTPKQLAEELTLRMGPDVQQATVDRQGKLIVFAQPQRGGDVRQVLETLGAGADSYELYEGEFRPIESLAPAAPPPAVTSTHTVFARPGARIQPVEGREGVLSCVVRAKDPNRTPRGLTVEHLFRRRNGEVVNNAVGRLGHFLAAGGLGADGTASADCAVFSLDEGVEWVAGQFPAHVGRNSLAATMGQNVHRQDLPAKKAKVVGVDFQARYKIDVVQNVNGIPTIGQRKVVLDNQILIRDDTQSFAVNRDSGVLILMSRSNRTGGFEAGAPLAVCTSMFDNGLFYTASPIAACLDLLGLAGIA